MTPLRKAGLTLLMVLVGVAPALTLLADPLPQPEREDATPEAALPPDATSTPDGVGESPQTGAAGESPTTLDEEDELDEGENEEERDDSRQERRKHLGDDEDQLGNDEDRRSKAGHDQRDEPAEDDPLISLRIGG